VGAVSGVDDRPPGRDVVCRALAAGERVLDEPRAKRLLAAYGLRVPRGVVVSEPEQAVPAAEQLGPTVVLKAVGPDIQHKSDTGLVAIDVRGAAAVRAAAQRIVERGAGRVRGILVEELVPHERELLVGMERDRRFGPVVAFGIGGIFTEVLRDVAFALAPLDEQEAEALLEQLRARRLLDAVRGLPCVDRAELRRIVRTIGQLALDHPEIAEIDVNPLAVVGSRLVVLDALVVLGKARHAVEEPDQAAPRRLARVEGATACRERGRSSLTAVFAPRSVAVVGASADEGKWGGSLLRNIVEGGYRGAVYPVNPRGGEIFGRRVFPSLNDIPEPPDLCLIALEAETSLSVVERCVERGVPAAIVIAAGFSEAGPAGENLERDLVAAARGGIALIGPNCMGVLANGIGLNAVGYVTLRPPKGSVSVVSQSGNIGTQLLMTAEGQGVGIEKSISVGNQALITAADVLDYLADDEATRAVIVYVEEMEDGRRFFDVARRATPKKPIVLMYGGATEAGSRAAASHTGAMAGSADVLVAAMWQAGVITTTDPDESLDLAACLAHLPLPRGRRVGVVTLGGGWGVLTADELVRNGLSLAELPGELLDELDGVLPSFWSRGNPVDLVASVGGDVPAHVLELLACCPAVDSVITLALIGSPSSGRTGRTNGQGDEAALEDASPSLSALGSRDLNAGEHAFLRRAAELMEQTGKPILSVPLIPVAHTVFADLGRFAPVVLTSPRAAVRALARMSWYVERRGRRARCGPAVADE